MKLNYEKMLEDINKTLLENEEFLFDMECRTLPKAKPFTQEDAERMEEILGKIYLIAHGTSCICGNKYIKK